MAITAPTPVKIPSQERYSDAAIREKAPARKAWMSPPWRMSRTVHKGIATTGFSPDYDAQVCR